MPPIPLPDDPSYNPPIYAWVFKDMTMYSGTPRIQINWDMQKIQIMGLNGTHQLLVYADNTLGGSVQGL